MTAYLSVDRLDDLLQIRLRQLVSCVRHATCSHQRSSARVARDALRPAKDCQPRLFHELRLL